MAATYRVGLLHGECTVDLVAWQEILIDGRSTISDDLPSPSLASGALVADESVQQLKAFVVEDQPMVASTLMDVLANSGIAVVGHAYDIPAAFAWLDRGLIPDMALVDVMLPSGPAYPLVDRLRELPTVTLLITGLACNQLPDAYQDLPCLEKPFGMHDLLKALAAMGQ